MVLTGQEHGGHEELSSEPTGLREGLVVSHRYRILEPAGHGWRAYDERLRRTVYVEPILQAGATPQQRIRSEAAFDLTLLDAFTWADTALAVRVSPPSSCDRRMPNLHSAPNGRSDQNSGR
jgi:hypothetical protein